MDLWSVIFGALGSGFCLYAKRQHALVTGACGVGLLVTPYLVSHTYVMVACAWHSRPAPS